MDNFAFENQNAPDAAPVTGETFFLANERSAGRTFLRVGLALAVFTLLPQAIALLIAFLCRNMDPAFQTSDLYVYGVQVLAVYVTAVPVAFWILGRPPKEDLAAARELGAPYSFRMTPVIFLVLFCIAEFLSVGGSLIGNFLMLLFGALTGSVPGNDVSELISGSSPIAVLLVVVIIGPIMEELLFRYGIARRLLPYGEKQAILLSGLFFGLAHGNFYQLFYTTAIGALFTFIYFRTKKMIYPIIFHIIFNFFGGFVPTVLMGMLPPELLEGTLTPEALPEILTTYLLPLLLFLLHTAFVYLAAIAGLVLFCIFISKQRFAPPALPIRPQKRLRVLLFNAGMIIFLALTLLLFALPLIESVLRLFALLLLPFALPLIESVLRLFALLLLP